MAESNGWFCGSVLRTKKHDGHRERSIKVFENQMIKDKQAMKTTAIVLAAGSGSRMKSSVRKQYMEIMGKPLLVYALEAFERSFIDEIVLVLPAEDIDHIKKNIVEPAGFSKIKALVSGGSTRYHSVRLGLESAS